MDNATCTREPARRRHAVLKGAFTLIELLVVISIIAVVAGLVVGLAGAAGERKKIARAQTERDRLVTLIENYRARLGVLPPDNTNNPGMNTLFYELACAYRNYNNPGTPENPVYQTRFTVNIRSNELYAAFGIPGLINAVDAKGDVTEMKPILKSLRPDQTNSLVPGTVSLVVPIQGTEGKDQPNPWKYLVGDHAVHNKESFDLWVDIVIGKKTITVGNWKD